jgi:hypothetical protein
MAAASTLVRYGETRSTFKSEVRSPLTPPPRPGDTEHRYRPVAPVTEQCGSDASREYRAGLEDRRAGAHTRRDMAAIGSIWHRRLGV